MSNFVLHSVYKQLIVLWKLKVCPYDIVSAAHKIRVYM